MTETNNIPKDWKWVKLGEYVKSVKGKKPKRLSSIKTKECCIPYVNIKAFEKNIIEEYTDGIGCVLCDEGDFVMVWDGSRSGYVGKSIKGALGSTLVKLDFPDIDNNYAYYFLQSKFMDINTRAKGVGIPHVDPNILWNYELLIPPLTTQQAIVSKIEELFSELDNGIAQLKTAQQQLKTYRQSVLKWAFEGKLTEDWRLVGMAGFEPSTSVPKVGLEPTISRPAIQSGKDSKSRSAARFESATDLRAEREGFATPDLPVGWKWVKSGELFSFVTSGSRGWAKYYSQSGAIFIRITNMDFNTLDLDLKESNIQYVNPPSGSEGIRTKIQEGDFLFSITGYLGMFAIAPKLDNAFVNQHVCLCRPKDGLNKKYVGYWIISESGGIHYLNKNKKGAVKAGLNLDDLKSFPVPITSLEEQHQVVQEIESRLSVADKLEESISASLQQAEALRQSILKRAFEGRLVIEKQESVYKPKNVYFYQMQILGLIAKASKKNDITHGEMTIAKYAYVLDKIYDIPTLYNYKRWHLGPYPPEIKKVINNKKHFKITKEGIDVLNEEILFKYNNPYIDQIENAVKDLAEVFTKYKGKKRAHKIELFATVCKVIEDTQTMDLQKVRSSMNDWKIDLKTTPFKNKAEKFTEEETESCLKYIKKKGWDVKLKKK